MIVKGAQFVCVIRVSVYGYSEWFLKILLQIRRSDIFLSNIFPIEAKNIIYKLFLSNINWGINPPQPTVQSVLWCPTSFRLLLSLIKIIYNLLFLSFSICLTVFLIENQKSDFQKSRVLRRDVTKLSSFNATLDVLRCSSDS